MLGSLAQVYVDEDTNEPLWAAVIFPAPSTVETVVPIHDGHLDGADLVTNYAWYVVMTAPRVIAGDELPWVEADRLHDHYGPHTPNAESTIMPITDAS